MYEPAPGTALHVSVTVPSPVCVAVKLAGSTGFAGVVAVDPGVGAAVGPPPVDTRGKELTGAFGAVSGPVGAPVPDVAAGLTVKPFANLIDCVPVMRLTSFGPTPVFSYIATRTTALVGEFTRTICADMSGPK